MVPPSTRRMSAALVLLLAACAETPTGPAAIRDFEPAFDHTAEHHVFTSGSHVTTWDPILPASYDSNWPSTVCTTQPAVGPNANWQNPHSAFVVPHPWSGLYFTAPWINAWNHNQSSGAGGVSPYHNWTKYRTQVSGEGAFVIRLLADNCSWIYLDGVLVGVQPANHNADNTSYGLTLNGTHTLEFVIFDGGGAAGGKYILETTTNPPPPLNNDLDDDGHVNDSDAFPLDPAEWADSDGDGVGDNGDAFPNDPGETVDTDGDGVGDNADAYPNDPTRSSFDGDGDGIADDVDNCPAVANADQADLDGDGTGDACDSDVDGDGVANDNDAFPLDPAESADSDGDGVGDNADAFDLSDTGATIMVGTCNTRAPNRHVGGGTWLNDLIAAAKASAANHGAFVSAVSSLADGWKKAGWISGREQGAIVSCAARSK
jgi:hypothetical protein